MFRLRTLFNVLLSLTLMAVLGQTFTSTRQPFYWEREFLAAITENSIQYSDMNRDGAPDVVAVQAFDQSNVKVIAMDGKSGNTIWGKDLKFGVYAMRCELDVNHDGVDDCILTGRYSSFAALDGVNGSILWEVDKSIVYPRYNFYFPLIVKDMDADGVEELINIHGGDQTYNAEETNRSPASLVVVSGATGQSLMDPIQLPDNYESYMSPVLFRMNGSLELVLIGTGGETFPGSLWAISMSSIKTRVVQKLIYMKQSLFMNNTCFLESDTLLRMSQPKFDDTVVDFTRPYLTSKLEAYCPKWSNIVPTWNKYGVCVYKLMNSTTKGIMLPPVIVDLNKDGVKDLVVSTFDGRTIALDGTDLVTQLWDIYYPNTETYSIPAPIFYTDNSVPEILIRTSLGEYPTYNSSTIRLLNGSDGAELWNFSSAHTSMMSPLTITSYSPGLDAMLFITVGSMSDSDSSPTGNMSHSNSNSNSTSDTLSNNIDKGNTADIWLSTPEDPFPDPDTDVTSFVEYCGQSIDQLASYVWLFTKEMIERGEELKPLAKHEPFVSILSNTNQSSEENARHDRDLDPSNISPKTKRCGHIVAPIMSFTTPALGDFNQDGRLDVAYSIVWGPLGGMMMVPPKFKVFVFTLEERFKEVYGSDVVVDFNGFLPSNEQPWSRYMGTTGDNVYRSNN